MQKHNKARGEGYNTRKTVLINPLYFKNRQNTILDRYPLVHKNQLQRDLSVW